MRALAIAMVVLFHQGLPLPGGMGVTIFFVLSGFLITRLLLQEVEKTGTISISNFYIRRALRIFPAFYVCWVLTMLTMITEHQPLNWMQAWQSFFYLANYGRAFVSPAAQVIFPMGISWSLAIEEQFYLLWPLTLLWIIHHRKLPANAIAVMIGVVTLWRIFLVTVVHASGSYLYNAFDTRADALLIGCWLSVVLAAAEVPRLLYAPLRSRWMVLGSMAVLCLAASIDRLPGFAAQLVNGSLVPVTCAVLILQLMFWGSIGWGFLESRGVKLLARLSYSIYLYHPLAMSFTRYIPIPHGQRAFILGIILIMAAASYYLIERPIIRLRDRGRRSSELLDDGLRHTVLPPTSVT